MYELRTRTKQPCMRATYIYIYTYTDLVGESDAEAEQDASDDEHGHVPGGPVDDGADHEDEPAAEHGRLAAEDARDGGREEAGDESGQIQRGGERRQQLTVELAVLIAPCRPLLLAVHLRKELRQKRVHRRHSAFH